MTSSASCSRASGSWSSRASARAAGRTRCRSGTSLRDGEIWIWTYAKSQKVRNLERDPRATLLVETGHEYTELRGVMIEAEAEIHRDLEPVFEFGKELTLRYAEGIESVEGDAAEALQGPGGEAGRDPLRRRGAPRPGTTASSAAATELSAER